MVIKNEVQTIVIEVVTPTGVYKRETPRGWTETRTTKSIRRTARVQVIVEVTDNLVGTIRKAYRAKGHVCKDGALTVKVREIERISDTPIPCTRCNGLHDSGIPCEDAAAVATVQEVR